MNISRFSKPALPLLLAFAAPVTALAQTAAVENRALADPLAGETRPANDAALLEDGGDPGELTRARRALTGRLSVDNEFTYQSNAELAGRGGKGDFVWFPGVTGSATYKLSETASIEGRASLVSGVYTDLTDLDFWGASGELLGRRALAGNWSLYGGLEAYDYQSLDNGDSLSSGVAPTAGASYLRYYAASRTYGFADIGVKHRYTDPAADERDEVKVAIGVTRQLAEHLYAQAFYEYKYSNYEEGGREDQRNYVNLSLIYAFSSSFNLRSGVSFINNESNASGADYQTVNTGLGSSVSWEF